MRVTTTVDVTAEVEIEVTPEEFIAELKALPTEHRDRSMLLTINTCYGVLIRIPQENIATLNDHQRALIADALHKEARRYAL